MDDLFGDTPQPQRAAASNSAKPLTADDVRSMMHELIAALRNAETVPFEASEYKKHLAMFPIMALWLPGDEGKQLCFEFEREVERLKSVA